MRRGVATLTSLLVIASVLVAGCTIEVVKGSGKLTTQDYALADFMKVDIESAFKVEIHQADAFGVNVTADDNILARIEVDKSGDTLHVGLKPTPGLTDVTLQAVISMPAIQELKVSGASHAVLFDFASLESLRLQASGASSISGDVNAIQTELNLSGASTVELRGAGTGLKADVSGAGHLKLAAFQIVDADVNLSGASDATINLTGRLDAHVSGASKLYYVGEPTMGDVDASGASTISKD